MKKRGKRRKRKKRRETRNDLADVRVPDREIDVVVGRVTEGDLVVVTEAGVTEAEVEIGKTRLVINFMNLQFRRGQDQ